MDRDEYDRLNENARARRAEDVARIAYAAFKGTAIGVNLALCFGFACADMWLMSSITGTFATVLLLF